jgi:hypothetical protein
MLPDLTNADDQDYVAFDSADPDWYLKVAGRAVRRFCGWHLAPSIESTVGKLRVGKGIVMLPSRFVTAVHEVRLNAEECGDDEHHGHRLRRHEYEWAQGGWVQLRGSSYWCDWYQGSYIYGNDQYYLPRTMAGLATVRFTHGYERAPIDVKHVIFELAEQALTLSSGNIASVEAPMFRLSLSQPAGLNLNKEQRNRLGPYRVPSVI